MWSVAAVALCLSVFGADADEKKPLSPKQKREAAEKAIKEKMAPIEKNLAHVNALLESAKRAKVTGQSPTSKFIGNTTAPATFRFPEEKKEYIAKQTAEIEKLTAELKPYQEQLKALKKPDQPKPAPKPEPAKPDPKKK